MQPLRWSRIKLQRSSPEPSSHLALLFPLSLISLLPLPSVFPRPPILLPTMSLWTWMLPEVPEVHSPSRNAVADLMLVSAAIVANPVT